MRSALSTALLPGAGCSAGASSPRSWYPAARPELCEKAPAWGVPESEAPTASRLLRYACSPEAEVLRLLQRCGPPACGPPACGVSGGAPKLAEEE